jgi:hypothetical protein
MAPPDGDVDAPTWRSRFLTLAQDANLVYDKMTGENGISSIDTCIHNGELGRGAPLRRTKAGQVLDRVNTNGVAIPEADQDQYGGEMCFVAVPFRVPQGETVYVVEVDYRVEIAPMRFRTYDSAFALVQDITVAAPQETQSNEQAFVAVMQFPAPGRYYLIVTADTGATTSAALRSWRAYPPGNLDASDSIIESDTANPFPVGTPTTELFETIHNEMIVDNYPIASWLIGTMSRNLNWLIEAATGMWPRGNASLQLADSGTTNPATAAFWAHSRAVWPSEPEVELPLFCEALGGIRATAIDSSGVSEPVNDTLTRGLVSFSPLIPTYGGTTRRTGYRRLCYVPDFQTASPRLKAVVLMANSDGKGTPTAWDARVTTGAGSSAAAAFVRLGTSDFYAAELTAIPFLADQLNTFDFEFARAAGATTHGEIMICGVEVDFDP